MMKQSRMKQFMVWCTAVLVLFGISELSVLHAQTKTTYRVNLIHLPGFINAIDTGIGVRFNQELLSRIEQREGITFEVVFYPAKRSFALFNEGDADLIMPTSLGAKGDDPFQYQSQATIDSAPFVGSAYVIFTLKSMPQLSTLRELAGKDVGVIRGNTLPKELDEIPFKSLQEVKVMEQNVEKLRADRIDAILVLKALGVAEMTRLNVSDIHSGRDCSYSFGSYSAHLTPEGARLIEYINKAIGEMILDGTYQTIFKDDPSNLLDTSDSE